MGRETEILAGRFFWRRALLCAFLALAGLAALAGALYFLYLMSPTEVVIDPERVHVSCPHSECKVPHPGANTSGGVLFGGSVLCVLYLVYVGSLTFFSNVWDVR